MRLILSPDFYCRCKFIGTQSVFWESKPGGKILGQQIKSCVSIAIFFSYTDPDYWDGHGTRVEFPYQKDKVLLQIFEKKNTLRGTKTTLNGRGLIFFSTPERCRFWDQIINQLIFKYLPFFSSIPQRVHAANSPAVDILILNTLLVTKLLF